MPGIGMLSRGRVKRHAVASVASGGLFGVPAARPKQKKDRGGSLMRLNRNLAGEQSAIPI